MATCHHGLRPDHACARFVAAEQRWRIYEVPVSYSSPTYEEGKKIGWRDAISAVGAIVYFRFMD